MEQNVRYSRKLFPCYFPKSPPSNYHFLPILRIYLGGKFANLKLQFCGTPGLNFPLVTHGKFRSIQLPIKGKAVPLQAWSGPEGSRKLRFPDFMTTAQDGGKVVSLTHRPPLPLENTPGTHFCWRLSRQQGHSAIGRILCQWHQLGSNQRPSDL